MELAALFGRFLILSIFPKLLEYFDLAGYDIGLPFFSLSNGIRAVNMKICHRLLCYGQDWTILYRF
jgi:hypothetical protein